MSNTEPHFSKAANKNKDFILEQLRKRCAPGAEVLEIASGTAQHAIHFASKMPDIIWQPSDRSFDEYGLADAIKDCSAPNLLPPILLDVTRWPNLNEAYDAVYSANCLHVMPTANLEPYISGAARALKLGGMMMLYGPFKYDGQFTTPSNEQFDAFLRGTYEDSGIRDFERVDTIAEHNGLEFHCDTAMPSNNQFLIWQKPLPAK